jgi:nitroreductase
VLERLWLEATGHGIAVHPLAGLLLLAFRCRFADGAGLSARHRRITESAVRSITEVVPAFSQRMPMMTLRLGYAPQPSARSTRLPLDAVYEVASAAPPAPAR